MSTPADRMAYLRQCEAEATAKVAPPYKAAALPSHDHEVMAPAGEGQPTVAQQDARNGAGIPALDRGPDPRGGAR